MRYHLRLLARAIRDTVRLHLRARATYTAVRELRDALDTLVADRRAGGVRPTAQALAADLRELSTQARATIHAAGLGPRVPAPAPFIPPGVVPPFARGLKPWTVYGHDGESLGTIWLSPSMGAEDIRAFLGDPDTCPASITVHPGRPA